MKELSKAFDRPRKKFTYVKISTVALPFECAGLEPVDLVADGLPEADLELLVSVVVLTLEVRLVFRVADHPVPSLILGHSVLDEVGSELASSLRGSREYVNTG